MLSLTSASSYCNVDGYNLIWYNNGIKTIRRLKTMNLLTIGYIVLIVLVVFGLLIIARDWLKKSESKIIRVCVLPFVTTTIFTTFKLIQRQGNNLDKDVIVASVVKVVYPQLPIIIRKTITQAMFQTIVDEGYLFIEHHCIKFSNLVEYEFSE